MNYNIKQTIQDARQMVGKMKYSMEDRWGNGLRDCSSFVLTALKGNIDNLPKDWYTVTEEKWLQDNGFKKMPLSTAQKAGDIYVIYETKNEAGANAHTFIASDDVNIIECNGYLDGVVERHFDKAMPKKWKGNLYRFEAPVVNSTPKKETQPKKQTEGKGSWTFHVQKTVTIYNKPSFSNPTQFYYLKGHAFNADSWVNKEGYTWASYMSNTGIRRYVPVETIDAKTKNATAEGF